MGSGHRPVISLPFLLLLLLCLILPFSTPADLDTDRSALLALRSAVGRSILASWNATAAACSFHGVKCGGGRVTALHLPGSGLIGQIPAGTLGNLTALRTISLRFNALSGPLPSDLAALSQLRNLYLHNNRFSGEIPPPVLALTGLVRLNLADNNFSGEIPVAFNNLTRLGTLFLERNSLSGSIPDLNLPNLVQFNVSYNNLNGSIPKSLRKMSQNAFLGMSVCGGPLPACPGEISPSPSPAAEGPAAGGGSGGGAAAGGGREGKKSSKLSGGAIAGIAIGSAVGLLLLLILLIFLCRKKGGSRERTAAVGTGAPKPQEVPMGEYPAPGSGSAAVAAVPKSAEAGGANGKKLVFFKDGGRGEFDLEGLLRASAEVLGKGTFGTVYKAVLEMGMMVAVKRLKDVNMSEREFKEKIEVIGAMDHPNLVPLKAYYFSKDEKLLVYDFMPMGSLSALLHSNRGSGRTPLSWETRSAIALAAARGLAYIHSTSSTSSHGNIKSSNILLCKSHEDARVSDHGLANLVGPAASSAPARAAGYRAPEVTEAWRVSQKADVYSFGVLLLELLTGKAPSQALLNDEGVDLPRWVQSVVREEWTSGVFDLELLRYQNVEEDMVQLLQLAIDCSAQYPDNRPSMPDVVARIDDIRRSSLAGRTEQSTGTGDDQSSRRTDSIDEAKS